MKKLASLILALSLFGCSSTPPANTSLAPEFYANLTAEAAEAQLDQVTSDLAAVEKEIRGAEVRRDSARLQKGQKSAKDDAVSGAEADLDSLQQKKGALMEHQMQLERRLRSLQSDI